MLKQVIVLSVVAMFAATVQAAPTISINHYDGTGGAAGFIVNEIIVDTGGLDLTAVDLALFPGGTPGCSGCIYHHDGIGGTGPMLNGPSMTDTVLDNAVHGHDDVLNDTYVQFGDHSASGIGVPGGGPVSGTGVFGASGHPLFGNAEKFDHDDILISYFNTSSNDIGLIKVAQITLSGQTNGDWFMNALVTGNLRADIPNGTIANGYLTTVIPVPAAAWMGISLLGGLGVTRLIRRMRAA